MNSTHTPQGRPLRRLPLSLITLAAFGALMAGAAQAQDSYWTFGLGGGPTRGTLDEQRITDNVRGPAPAGGFTNYSLATDRSDKGYKVFLGRQFNKFLGVELGYFNLGKIDFKNTTTPAGALNGQVRAQGANLDLVATLPLTTNLSALGRVGAAYARTRSEFSGSGALTVANPQPSRREANMKLGLGLQYAFNDSFLMRGEAERYRINDAAGGHGNVNLYSVSLVFPFGRSAAPAPRAAYVAPAPAPMPMPMPAPVVVVEAAPPPPVVVMTPAPAPVPLRRVSYSAESLFGYDKSVVRPEGKAALDGFAAELAGTRFDSVTVEGHTDRLGSTAYNQRLSEQRAEAVKSYLVENGRVDASKIRAVGMSEGTPVTKPEDCKGNAKTAALISCLQPDRRVEIEVSGTR